MTSPLRRTEMFSTLQGIQHLEQDRARAVGELQRLQRAVARRNEQDKEASKAAEQRRIETAEQIKVLEKEKAELQEKVRLLKTAETVGGFGLSVVGGCYNWQVASLLPALALAVREARSFKHACLLLLSFVLISTFSSLTVSFMEQRNLERQQSRELAQMEHFQSLMQGTSAYRNVCGSGPYAAGLTIAVTGVLNTTFEVSCGASSKQCVAEANPTGGCAAGPAAFAFTAVDEDKTLKISLAEAANVPDTIFTTARGACGMEHVTAVRSRVESCFHAASGADELLARREYQGAFMPCLIRSLADPCQSAVCSDP